MTVEFLKEMFIEKYGNCILFEETPRVIVTLTLDQYKELNNDIIKLTNPHSLILNEPMMNIVNPENLEYMRIMMPKLCDLMIELGDEFGMRLFDESQEHGDEYL